jgi:nicotinamidase-related amidase
VPSALLLIDLQMDYFPGGAMELVGAEAAVAQAATALAAARASGVPVIHLRHSWDAPDAAYLRPGTPGAEIHSAVMPVDGEPVIVKEAPNGFLKTRLSDVLREADASDLVVAGMMTSMCVDATVRAAVDLGHDVTVIHDACAAPDLEFEDRTVPGAIVHTAFIAALADGYAETTSAAAFTP